MIPLCLILSPKEGENRERGCRHEDNKKTGKDRIQPSDTSPRISDQKRRERPGLPWGHTAMGEQELTINTTKTGGKDHEEERSYRQKEICKNGREDLDGPHVHAG